MKPARIALTIGLAAVIGLWAGLGRAAAQPRPSAEVLLPYFEVEAKANGTTTMLAIANALDDPVDIQISLYSNWGIAISQMPLTLAAREVRTFNLATWVNGQVPGRSLTGVALSHLKAALSGQKSPKDNLYYSTPVAGRFTGYVRIVTQSPKRPAALWGDYFFLDQARHITYANDLVNLDTQVGCPGVCKRHALRFLAGAPFDGGTRVMVWTRKTGQPAASPKPGALLSQSDATIYDEAGTPQGSSQKSFLSTQSLTLADLGVHQPFGWLDLETESDVFIAVQYGAANGLSLGLLAYCLPIPPPPPAPGIHLRKLTNGVDANDPPGPSIPVGDPVLWEYVVENASGVKLSDIKVTDDQGEQVSCPGTTLDPGASMTCTAHGTAVACQYSNVGTVIAKDPNGVEVEASDPSHYFGDQNSAIAIEKRTNGQHVTAAPGPQVAVGSPVAWTYLVTNTGDVQLTNVKVADDKGVVVTCPKTSLNPGEAMTCTGAGTAAAGQYQNTGTVTASDSCGVQVSAHDVSYYFGQTSQACVKLKKYTNGDDADTAPGPHIQAGAAVAWDYAVTNCGQAALGSVHVTDNRSVAVSCPKSTLAVGETMHCSGSGTATAGQYENIGTVTANPPTGSPVTSSDPSHYFGDTPTPPPTPPTVGITIKKYTNGDDADTAPGPHIPVGSAVAWDYVVTNSGQTVLSSVHVTDNRSVAVSCPKSALAVGEVMHCSGSGTATVGQYENIGTVTANPPTGSPVTASDPSHYYGDTPPPATSCITIKKYTNGEDADTAPGPHIQVGAAVAWDYKVTNSGQTALSSVHVTDNRGVAVSCPKSSLAIGETMHCSGNGTATAGQYENIGTVTANPPSGSPVTSSDPSHYYGDTPPPAQQGCSPGYWKNHPNSWTSTGYSTSQSVQSVFSAASGYPGLGSASLLSSLSFQGGSDLNGAAGNLLRAGTASLLNAAHPQVGFPLTQTSVISQVNAALNSKNRDTILSLAAELDGDNNLSCPLN